MKKTRRILAVVLTLCMLLSILPLNAFAVESNGRFSGLTATEIPGLSRLEGKDFN